MTLDADADFKKNRLCRGPVSAIIASNQRNRNTVNLENLYDAIGALGANMRLNDPHLAHEDAITVHFPAKGGLDKRLWVFSSERSRGK